MKNLQSISIPTRRELVKEAARNPTVTELKQSRLEKAEYGWTVDPLSKQALVRPVVSDALGRLYNKDSIIQFLLPSDDDNNKTEWAEMLQGVVKSLRDAVEVRFEVDEERNERSNGIVRVEKWKCPITNESLGPGSKAVYVVPCGHAFSESVIKEISEEKCPQVR